MVHSQDALSLDQVTKRYRGEAAVDDVTLTIPGGTFFSLLGPSGSGKTTLLMIIAGFTACDSGTLRLGRRDITTVAPERRNFGMMFQGYALFPNLTVAENVAFALTVRHVGRAKRDAQVRAALDLVQLKGLDDRAPRQLSGGQQQRVALARALVFEPDMLLLDEPLSALDKKLRIGLQSELRELQRRVGTTFICVTHDQEEALSMSDEIAIIHRGRIVQSGAPQALFEYPRSHFVADFLGESNFLEGNVTAAERNGLRYMSGGVSLCQAGATARRQGERLLVALRPSKITLTGDEPTTPNRVAGRLTQWSYRGTEFHCLVESSLGVLAVSCPTWQSHFSPVPGLRVWLGWSADAAVVVEDDRRYNVASMS